MKLLSVCIYAGILLFLVDLSLAKRRDENSIDVSDEAQDDEGEEEDAPKKRRINKKHSKKQSDEEDYDEDDDTFYVCIKDDKDPICKCDDNILNCENGDLDETDVYVKDNQFVIKTANFKNNKIKTLKTKGVLPGAFEVEELDFSKNLIKKIEDKCFNGFDDLKILRLSSNRLTTVSNRYLTEKIGNSLHQLFLDDNLIVKIPATAFSELKNLKKLVLDGNANIKLSKTTFSTALANLEILSLDRCNISDLEDNVFEQLTNLEQLSLRNNPIVAIPKAINAIPNLFALDLSATEICEFTADKISADHNLTEIHLSNMKCLYAVYDCAFCSLSKLEIVDLSNNTQLYNIHENAFGAITKEKDSNYVVANLKEFDIQNSNFSILPQKLFDWSKIKTLKIHGNPFNCSCDLAWLVNDKNIHYETNPKCGAPAALNGTYFSKVADSVCDGKTSASSGSSSVLWAFVLFLIVIGLVGGFLLYTRRVRVTNILYRPEVPQMGYSNLTTQQQHPSQHDDEEELQGDFQPRPDATPVFF